MKYHCDSGFLNALFIWVEWNQTTASHLKFPRVRMCERERESKLWVQGWASVPVEAIRWSWCLTEKGRKRKGERGKTREK